MDVQQQLFGLMAVAEEHQKAVKAVLDRLTAERATLARERDAVAQAVASVSGVAGEVRKAAAEIIPALQEAAGEAIDASVRQSFTGASETAAKALGDASRPIIAQLSGVVKAAGDAEGKLSGAVAAFGWRWAMLAGGAAAGGILTVLLVTWLMVWWQRHQVEELTGQKAALVSEVAQLQAQAGDWARRGGRARLDKCGDAARLCVRVDKSTGYGKNGDYFVLRGY
jgi:ABC-type transporter Mla subunit MlaD